MRTYTFEVKGKTHTLKYDFNAICDIEELAGVGISEFVSEKKVGMNTIRLVLWGGLKWKNNGLTKQQVGFIVRDYIEEGGEISELANHAFSLLSKAINVKSDVEEEEDIKNEEG